MKKLIFISSLLTLFVMVMPVMAQEELLFSGEFHTGGCGGPISRVTVFNDELGYMMGGRGVWTVNHVFSIGGGGYALTSEINAPFSDQYMNVSYGGMVMEYNIFPQKLIHFSLNTLIGGGMVNYGRRHQELYIDPNDKHYSWDDFFVAEPGINLEINIVKYFRIGFGVSYRYVNGVDIRGLDDRDMSGLSANVMFKFGSF